MKYQSGCTDAAVRETCPSAAARPWVRCPSLQPRSATPLSEKYKVNNKEAKKEQNKSAIGLPITRYPSMVYDLLPHTFHIHVHASFMLSHHCSVLKIVLDASRGHFKPQQAFYMLLRCVLGACEVRIGSLTRGTKHMEENNRPDHPKHSEICRRISWDNYDSTYRFPSPKSKWQCLQVSYFTATYSSRQRNGQLRTSIHRPGCTSVMYMLNESFTKSIGLAAMALRIPASKKRSACSCVRMSSRIGMENVAFVARDSLVN